MTKFTNPKALQILKEEQAANDAFFAQMDAKIKDAKDNTFDKQIWTTPNQRRLIAAAPELLEALKLAQYLLTIPAIQEIKNSQVADGYKSPIADFEEAARAAILKAEG